MSYCGLRIADCGFPHGRSATACRQQSAFRNPHSAIVFTCVVVLIAIASCRQDMNDQPRAEPLEASPLFPDGRASRPLVPGTVARGQLRSDAPRFTGRTAAGFATEFPFAVTRDVLNRGQERYNIYCAPCHAMTGDGHGMIVQRGFPPGESFNSPRLRAEPVGYYFDATTNGYRTMYGMAEMVPVDDRWAIIAYIRALQLSQYAEADRLAPEDRTRLDAVPSTTTATHEAPIGP